jgi:amidase
VADAAAGLDVVAVHDPGYWFSPPPRPAGTYASALHAPAPTGLRVATMRSAPGDLVPVDPACVAAVDATLAALADAGHHLTDDLPERPDPGELVEAFGALWNTGSAYSDIDDWDAIEPLNKALREAGRGLDSIAFTEAVVKTQKLSRRIVSSFAAGFDLLVTPTMACLPPAVGSWRAGMETDPMMGMFNCFPMGIFTSIFNVIGLPGISLPIAVDEATNLPVGVQVVAAPWREDLLLQVAAALEPVFGWDRRRAAVVA